jgi:type VI secretion system protein ImpH
MGAHGWGSDHPLTDLLLEESYRFEFYQAVKLLEILYSDKVPTGEGSEPEKEAVRFKSRVSHDFPASEIYEITGKDHNAKPSEMEINFMGLAGCLGPLPIPYTELILERARKKDTAFKAFLDIFNHRLVSILFRVRKTFRIGFEFTAPVKSRFARYLFSFFGLGTAGLQERMQVKDRALLYYTGLLSQQPRSMRGLEHILSDYFNVSVKGVQLVGQWYHIEADEITHIGFSGQNQILGRSALLGTRAWDHQGKFELHFESLNFDKFSAFLPPGRSYGPLSQLTRFYAGTEFDFDFVLNLQAPEVPQSRLGGLQGPRLGWTSWLNSGNARAEAGRVRLSPRLLGKLKDAFGFDYERKTRE